MGEKQIVKLLKDAIKEPPEVTVAKKLKSTGVTEENLWCLQSNEWKCLPEPWRLKVIYALRDLERGWVARGY